MHVDEVTAHLDAMRANGLAIESTDPAQSLHLTKVSVTDDPKTIGPVDMVLFAVKLWDTEAAARQILPIMTSETGLISFQNGVVKDDMLRPIVGEAALMGGVANVGTTISRPGAIAHTGNLQRRGLRVDRDEVAYGAGRYEVVLGDVQPQGRRMMPAVDWARGARIRPGELFG